MASNRTAVLIDAGTGNLHSVYHALISQGFDIKVSDNPADLSKPGRVILPGVGSFARFVEGLRQRNLEETLRTAIDRGDPFLGICVGMQALFETSVEMGEHPGLGLLPGKVRRFESRSGYKIPHTGWNQLWQIDAHMSPLMEGIGSGNYAYFNHSYYCQPGLSEDTVAITDYCIEFTSVVQRANLFGVQFHPEKSQQTGLKLLQNFMRL